jgi:hypothetical protein
MTKLYAHWFGSLWLPVMEIKEASRMSGTTLSIVHTSSLLLLKMTPG